MSAEVFGVQSAADWEDFWQAGVDAKTGFAKGERRRATRKGRKDRPAFMSSGQRLTALASIDAGQPPEVYLSARSPDSSRVWGRVYRVRRPHS